MSQKSSSASNAAKKVRPYGSWPSPITASALAGGLSFGDVHWTSDGKACVWSQKADGRGSLYYRQEQEAPRLLTPDVSVRAKVGYGGGDFCVGGEDVFFFEAQSGALFKQKIADGTPKRLSIPHGVGAAPTVSANGQFVLYVHRDDSDVDRLMVVDRDGEQWPRILVEGADFYVQPAWSPCGQYLAYVAWDHPQMPWDGSRLHVARIRWQEEGDGGWPVIEDQFLVAGGTETAVFQPVFAPDMPHLYFVSDESGFGQLQVFDLEKLTATPVSVEQEFSQNEFGIPNWVQGMRTYGVADGGRILAAVGQGAKAPLYEFDAATGKGQQVADAQDYTCFTQVAVSRSGRVVGIAHGPQQPHRVVEAGRCQAGDRQGPWIHARSQAELIHPDDLGTAEELTWQSRSGEDVHGIFLRPRNRRIEGPGLPPLLTLIHGGPTSAAPAGWADKIQFFVTRGWAVLLVNHRGSTGYGRDYMLKLRGNWGVYDAEDAVSGCEFLVKKGFIDAERTVIMGGSAGGYTVLQTMIHFPEVYTAGISMYGVANQFTLAADTHKFEERYLDSLLGPLPESAELYRERSPVYHADKIRRPLAVFQGGKDTVVPQDQSDAIVAALRRNGTPHVYHVYPEEGHGWRRAETVQHFYDHVEKFLSEYVLNA